MATTQRNPQLVYELLWWSFTLVLAALVLTPVYVYIPDFPFYFSNIVYIVVAVTLTRYLFFLRISWFRDRLIVQAALGVLLIPLIFWMVQHFNTFVTYLDEENPDIFIKHLPERLGAFVDVYLNNEYKFFAVWAIIAALITPFRLVYNVWSRYRAGVR